LAADPSPPRQPEPRQLTHDHDQEVAYRQWGAKAIHPRAGPAADHLRGEDHNVPPAPANASYKQQQDNHGVTEIIEIIEIKNRGHALTIDSGWREVADTALAFVKRFR
jgi:hypothetical protein